MEGINDANITPSRRMLRVRVKKTPPPDFCTSSTPGSRSAQRRGAGKELTKPFWTKLSHQKGKVIGKITPAEFDDVVSPQASGTKGSPKAALRMVSNRATPGKIGIAKYVITPHTVQEHDVGLTLASLKTVPKPAEPPIVSSSASYKLTFPETIYRMVAETNESDPDVIYWVLDGEAFVVREKDKKLGQILKKHFRHGKYSSLQRQLNMYGWKKYMKGRFEGAFHNPEFHRDITRGKLVRILRRGPPVPAENKKSTKARLNTRGVTDDTHSDDEWQPGNASPSMSSNLKERPSRVSKKTTMPAWGDSDEENMEPEAVSHRKTKARTPSAATRKRTHDDLESSKNHRPCDAKGRTRDFRTKSHSSNHLTPTRRFGDSPRRIGASLLSSGADDSPTANWSPLIGGLMRQESIVAQKTDASLVNTTGYNTDGLKVVRHPGETCWTMWRQSAHPGTLETNWAGRSDQVTNSSQSTRDISPFVTTSAALCQYPREQNCAQGRTAQDLASRTSLAVLPSSGGVCPVSYAPSLSRSLVSAPPLFSRENSAPFPIALAQRVSSSFFLPFMGMADTLSYALEIHNDNDPSTPTRAA